nr:hypothetical protein [Ensifer sp. IC4062]
MGAMIALQTLRSLSSKVEQTQTEISSGLRVSTAADNAAYWSVATTMRSDTGANLAVADALGISASIVELAYSGLEATIEAVENIRNRLIASMDEGVDKDKLQIEIRQLAAQTVSIANSSSFAGVNWLKTDVFDMYETTKERRQTELLSAFMRNGQSQVTADFFKLDLLETSLFNKDGGGILDGDPRSPKTVGGLRARHWDIDLERYDGYDSVGNASADPGRSFVSATNSPRLSALTEWQ